MTRHSTTKQIKSRCEGCGASVPTYDSVHYGSPQTGYQDLCTRCLNADVAKRFGLTEFENLALQNIIMTDRHRKKHEFHFQTRLLGSVVTIEAFELKNGSPGGYQFAIAGHPEEEIYGLLGRLIERMRRRLAVKDLKRDRLGRSIAKDIVRGHIGWDEDSGGQIPHLVIDGEEVSWEAFGRMLMSFEGWQFRMQLIDPSGET